MLELRILGPLEATDERGPVQLGGPRQRALLALLLLNAGRHVPTEQLVDRIYGEDPPRTATTSLQNSIAALRRALGAERLQTGPGGYMLAVGREAIDAARLELLITEARGAEPARRRELAQRALDLFRGPPLADFRYEDWAQAEIARLSELHLVAHEERLGADIELGRAADAVPELEALAATQRLRERPRLLLMLALHRSGRTAEALEAYRGWRGTLVDELGIEPGAEIRQLHSRILRGELGTGPDGASRSGRARDDEGEIVRALLAGRVVPVLGLTGASELAAGLASAFSYPAGNSTDLTRVSQWVATMNGAGPLYDELHDRFSVPPAPGPLHRFLASLPTALRAHGSAYQLIVTTHYDLSLEQAFADAGEELDIVTYVSTGPSRGRFWHRPPGEEPRPIDVPNTYATELSLERRTVLLKLHGAVDPAPEREWESFVVTEDDYIDYLGRSEVAAAVPVALAARLRRSHFLFLGYSLADWNLRLVVSRVWGDRPVVYRSWAVEAEPGALESAFWRRFDVAVVDADPAEYADVLARRLDAGA